MALHAMPSENGMTLTLSTHGQAGLVWLPKPDTLFSFFRLRKQMRIGSGSPSSHSFLEIEIPREFLLPPLIIVYYPYRHPQTSFLLVH